MRAVVLRTPGPEPGIEVEEIETPSPDQGEVLVRLAWASLNHLDLWVRMGLPGGKYPHVCGADGSGTVAATGDDVTDLQAGTHVLLDPTIACGRCEYCSQGEHSLCNKISLLGEGLDGTFAQYLSVPRENVHPVPPGVSLKEAAAFPLTFVTAWRMLASKAELREGEWILIHGIGGGVSTACLILSKMLKAKVIATSGSREKLERAREAGAEEVIHYRDQDVENEVRRITGRRGVDVVVDSVGKSTWLTSIRSLARGGRLVTCGATTGPDPVTNIARIYWNQLTIFGSTMGNRKEFREMLDAVTSSGLRPIVDSEFPMDDFARAYERMEEANQFGKILLEIP